MKKCPICDKEMVDWKQHYQKLIFCYHCVEDHYDEWSREFGKTVLCRIIDTLFLFYYCIKGHYSKSVRDRKLVICRIVDTVFLSNSENAIKAINKARRDYNYFSFRKLSWKKDGF